uniref:TSL-kinase interacting protein 1-like n=1 Tax=Globodera pallida TaxID=36090 RepID=A0A183C5F3_GLOPA
MIARCSNKAGHLSLMRNMVRDMWAFKMDEKKEKALQRGKGIGLKMPMNWPESDNGGWADATKLFGCDKPSNPTTRTAQREIIGLAPKAPTVATIVRPKQVCQPTVITNSWYQVVRGKKTKKTSVRKGNHASGAQAKQSSGDQNPCAPINGRAKTYAQAVAYLPPVVKSQAYKPLWKRDPDYAVELTTRLLKWITLLQRQKKPNINICWEFFDKFPKIDQVRWHHQSYLQHRTPPKLNGEELIVSSPSLMMLHIHPLILNDQTGMVTPQSQSFGSEQQLAPDEGLDSYEDATDQNAFTDAAQQDLAESLGINSMNKFT